MNIRNKPKRQYFVKRRVHKVCGIALIIPDAMAAVMNGEVPTEISRHRGVQGAFAKRLKDKKISFLGVK